MASNRFKFTQIVQVHATEIVNVLGGNKTKTKNFISGLNV